MSGGFCVLGTRVKGRIQLNFPAHALENAQNFAIGNHALALIFRLVDGHTVDQTKCSRFGLKCCFQDIGAGKISARCFVVTGRRNSPKTAFFDVEDGSEKRRTVKPGPAKPVQRSLTRYQRCRSTIANNAVVGDRRRHVASVTHSGFHSQHTYADAKGGSSRWLAPGRYRLLEDL